MSPYFAEVVSKMVENVDPHQGYESSELRAARRERSEVSINAMSNVEFASALGQALDDIWREANRNARSPF